MIWICNPLVSFLEKVSNYDPPVTVSWDLVIALGMSDCLYSDRLKDVLGKTLKCPVYYNMSLSLGRGLTIKSTAHNVLIVSVGFLSFLPP